MEYYVNKNKAKSKEYAKKVLEEEKKYSTDLSTVSVNSFLDKANKYFSSADKSLRSTGYSTASKNAEDRRKQAQELRMEALGVDRYLDINKSSMDENTYKTLKQYVSEIGYETAKVTDAFDTAEDYYSQFSDREKFNDYRENIRQNAWLDKYQNKNYTDLNILASKMADGDEKNWVKRYATSKYTPEEGYMEVSRLENVLDEYNRLLKGNVNDPKNQERLRDITSRYGGKDDLEALISQTRQRNTLYDRELERQKLTSVGDRESANYDTEFDYWAKSRTAVPTRQDIENYDIMMDNSTWQVSDDGRMYDAFGNEIDTGKRDANGKVIHPAAGSVNTSDRLGIYLAAKNDTTDYSVAERAWGTVDQIIAEGNSRHWDRLSEDQINTYYYYLNKQGADAANRYLDLIQDTVNKELGEEIYSEMQDSNALKTLFGVKAGLEQFEAGMGGFGRQLRGENDYVAPSAEQYAGAMARENLDGMWGVAYDTASTVANMAPSILAGTLANAFVPGAGFVGSLVMGAGASGNAYDQMINEGYTVDQARTYGALVGVSEVALENLLGGISEFGGSALSKGLQKAMTAADNALLKVAVSAGDTAIGRILSNMISEGTEEGLQEILGTWLKNLITHSEENVNWEEVAYSTLLGALTGGIFEGASVGANALQTNAVRKDVGKTIMAADGGVDALKALALDVSGAGSKLVNQAEKVTGETAVGKNFTGKVVAAAKNSANQKRIGKLYEGVRSEVSAQNRADIAKLLGEKGFSSTSAKNIAEAIAARINGDETNKFQDMVLDEVKDNSAVNEVVKTVLTDEASLVSKRTTDLDLYSRGVAAGKGIAPTKTERPDYDVSEDGKTILHNTDGTAREVEVKKVSEIKDGKVKLELNDGTVVEADQVSFASTGEAWTYSVLAEIGATAEEANDILSFYEGSTDIDRVAYARGVQEAYRYGTIGVPVDKISAASFASRMSPEARAYAYNIGAIQAVKNANVKYNERINKKLGNGKYHDSFTIERNGVHFDDVDISTEKLNAYQKTGIQLAEFLAALGMDVHVFKSQKVDGKYVSENGSYIMDDGSVHVDLMAGNIGQGTVAYTLSHETTHFIKDWSPEKFKVFADALFTEVGKSEADIEKMVAGTLNRIRSMKEYKGKSEAELWDIAYDEVVAEMCETMLTDTDVAVRVAENLKKTDSELLNKIIEFFNNLLTKLKGLLKVNAAYKNATPDSYIAQQASETIKKVEKLRDLYAEALVDATATFRNAQSVEAVGIQVDTETESVAPAELHSERTWTASEYVQNREKAAQTISKQLNVSVKEALQYIDDINSVARLIADDRVRLDYDSNVDEHATVLKPNSEYKYTVDMSTLCAKRLLFTGTFDAIQKALPNTVFDSEDIVRLREMMMQRNLEVACGICYVESTRREIGRITQEFIDRYKIAQKTGQPISRINSSGKEVTLTSKGVTFMADPNYTPNLGELNTTDIDYVKRDHREVYDAYLAFMNARGQAKPKLLETRAEYKGEILKSFKAKSAVNARNAHGGLRLQSFSDFEVPHMIDMMQIIMDMSRVGLQSQAYTKVPAFAEVFGGTGVKINLSLIAKGSGLDANGNLIFDDVEGINHKEAFRLREKYSKDVGTILVGKNDQHIIAAMADPRIDFIIPFHKSSWKESLYDALGLTGYEDYTETQNEKPFDKSRDIKNFDPSEYWDFTKTGDENAQIYLQKCREDGRIPKFPQFQGYPGYWKLLIDFKMYDNNGVGSPQEVVRPSFDMDGARSILNEYKGGHRSFPVAKDVVNDFVNEYKAKNTSEVRKSSRYDTDYMNAVKRGDMETAQRLVDALAKKAGFTSPMLFHGTSKFGFTKFDPAFSDDKMSIFLSSNNLVAETYSGKTEKYKVSQRATITPEALDKASPETILKLLQENVDYRIEMIGENEMKQIINKHRSELKNAIRMAEQVPVLMADKWNSSAQKDLDKVMASLRKLAEASDYNEFMDAYDDYEGALFDMRWENDAATNVLYELVRDDVNSAYRGLTNYIGTTLYRGNTEYTKRNGKDIFNINEAVSELYKVLYRGVYQLYTNPGNQLVINAEGSNWNQIDGKLINSSGPVRTRDVAKYAKENGYDSVLIENLRDSGDYSYMGQSDVYIFFGGDRLKSADPVTYDDDGNVIPLSKRFDSTNEDIRYALRGNYWYPNMTRTELREIESIAKNRIYKDKNYVGIGVKFLYNTEKGHEYFALYSTADEKDPTILYACKNSRANYEHDVLKKILERKEHIYGRANTDAGVADRLLGSVGDVLSGTGVYNSFSVGTGSNKGNGSIYSGHKGKRPSAAFENCLKNIAENQKQASIDERYQFAVDIEDYATAQRMVDEASIKSLGNNLGTGEENNIYIPDGHNKVTGETVDFANAILDGIKKGETRTHKSLTRKWVGIAKDGKVIGRVRLGDPIVLRKGTQEYRDSLIEGTEYDIKDGETKYYYPVIEVMDLRDNPRPILRNGNYGQYQFKSNEAVTYDDDGNVIPLSKRFDPTNEDIRYSTRNEITIEKPSDNKYIRMVENGATHIGEYDVVPKSKEPKKTILAWKALVVKPGAKNNPKDKSYGNMYPPQVHQVASTPYGVWLYANEAPKKLDKDGNPVLTKFGRPKVKEGMTYRPAWHFGDAPYASQFKTTHGFFDDNGVRRFYMAESKGILVWALCEMAADENYQDEADMAGHVGEDRMWDEQQASLWYMPENGYYKYMTNRVDPNSVTWYLSDKMRIVQTITDTEMRDILNWIKEDGSTDLEFNYPLRLDGKDVNPSDYGIPVGNVVGDGIDYVEKWKNQFREIALNGDIDITQSHFYYVPSAASSYGDYETVSFSKEVDDHSQELLKTKKDAQILTVNPASSSTATKAFETSSGVKVKEAKSKAGRMKIIESAKNLGYDIVEFTKVNDNLGADVVIVNPNAVIRNYKFNNVSERHGKTDAVRYSSRVKVDTTGMDEDAKKIIRKLEIRATGSKYDEGQYASYSAERMEREIYNSSSATRMDYAKSYIAWVNPDDFLYATTTSDQVRAKIEEEAGELDLERLRKETQPIHLTVDFETGDIKGHEGRHRLTALSKAGVEKVAVIFDAWNDDRYNTKPISMMKINGQVFDRYHYGHGFYVHDMLPISKRYADAVRQLFSDVAGSVRFSERTEDSVSNRSLLANALESTTQHEVEKTRLQEYKDKIAAMDAEEQKLSDINAQIKEISFGQGPRDTKKLSKLQQEKTKIQNRINTYDKQLLRLESTKVLQNVLAREKQKAYKRAEARGQEALEAYKKAADKRYENFVNKQEEKRKNAVEARKRTEIRHKIQRVVNELNDLLLNESKTRHVPDSLKKAVAGALSILNMDTVAAEERAAKYAALIAKERAKDEPDQEKIDAYTSTMENILRRGEKMGQKLKELKEAYEEIENSTDPDIALAYDPVIAGAIKELSQTIGDTSIMDMSIEQLSDVYDVYKMVLTRVRDANKAMAENIKATISQMASNVISEVRAAGGQHKMRVSMLDPVKKFFWNNMKPVYAMEYIGSSTLTHVFNNVRAGEDVWAKDVTEAREYYLDKAKKYGYNDWDLNKKYKFTSTSDLEFELTLEQMLSLYAYSKREQAHDHLRLGGFVFDSNIETTKEKNGIIKYKVNTADAHQISIEILAEIIGKLTSEQLGFVDEMQAYLSTTMGAKGNEVTSKMYGVKLFKEKNYFPLKSASQFMFEQNQVAGEVRIKNSGFTNKVVAKANNPIILSNFMDVWSNHVNDMSMYHAFTLPLEDFNRVFNFDSPKQEGIPAQSVKGTIQNAYTPAAVHYVKQLITDLNGGARTDPTTDIITKMMGLFKKGAVFASASVVIQQPSAIARASALIDTKYFIGPKVDQKKHKILWEELKKYAPVAIIKEMGYFDTHMGKSTQDFIQGKEYEGIKEQFKALFTDNDYRDEQLSKAPALADELAWVGIWEAVKRETKAKYPGLDVKGDPFLKLAGSRFTEVITKTQVYDSVLSRSANMRSKDTGMKMATAFMAEPTTSINMITDALLKGKRGNKKYARKAIGSVIASMLLNSMLVAFVYAGRDDDEDKTYAEKYIESFLGSALDGLNPATYIPFIKDIASIVQGYDVERSDMAVISDLWNAVQKLKSDKVSAYRKIEDFAGSIAQIFGLPVKNIMRDVRSVYQTLWPAKKQKTTAAGIGYAALSAVGKDVSDQEQLYRAFVNVNAEHLARVEGRYSTKKKANTAMRSAIKEHYLAGDITAETAMDYMVKYCDDKKDDAYWKIEEWNHEAKFEETFGKYDEFYGAVQTGKDLKATIKKYTDNGVTEETLRSQITDHFKEKYIKMTNAEKAAIKGYLLNAMTVLGNTRQEAEDKIKDWEFEATHGFSYNNRRQEYLEGDITKEQLEDALVNYGGLDEEEVEDYFSDTLFEAEYGFPYNHTGKLYKDGTLSRDEAFHIFTTQGEMSAEKANVKIAELDFEIEHGFSYSEKRDLFINGDITAAELKQYIMSVEKKTEEEANSAIVSYVRDAYSDGEIDRTFAINTMTRYAGVEAEDAENKLRYIDVKQQYPDTYVDDAWVEEYYKEIESSGMAMDVFFEYRNQVKGITGKGKKENRLAVINSMPISTAQKDALYYAEGWAKSKIHEAPWH